MAKAIPNPKRLSLTILVALIAIPGIFLVTLRFRVVSSEGYRGEVVIELPADIQILDAGCTDRRAQVLIEGQVVTTRIGDSRSLIILTIQIADKIHEICFKPQKLNDWNRIRFEPINSADPLAGFIKFENGVRKPHNDFTIIQSFSCGPGLSNPLPGVPQHP